jgi:copper resistance protein B
MDMPAPSAGPAPPAMAPPPPSDHAADRYYDPAAMDRARAILLEHGAMRTSKLMLNIAEFQAGEDGGYRWNVEGWYGGDLNRLVVKSEGEGRRRGGLEAAELQALYSRAIGPYADLQAGVRQDLAPYGRSYATVGFETLLPFRIKAGGALFLAPQGELLARLEGAYDLRLAQRLVLQPRAELEFAAQNSPETRTGAGLSRSDLDLRLRYEIRRRFAPYVGVSWTHSYGRTADYLSAAGDRTRRTSFVAGLAGWF